MIEKTVMEMDLRKGYLNGLRSRGELSLRTAGELDCIENYGIVGWRQWLRTMERVRIEKLAKKHSPKPKRVIETKKRNKK